MKNEKKRNMSENLQKSIKSDVSDTNGRRENDFQVEISPNDIVKTDFRSTVTHFITFLMISQFFCAKSLVFVRDREMETQTAAE